MAIYAEALVIQQRKSLKRTNTQSSEWTYKVHLHNIVTVVFFKKIIQQNTQKHLKMKWPRWQRPT